MTSNWTKTQKETVRLEMFLEELSKHTTLSYTDLPNIYDIITRGCSTEQNTYSV